jgi:hypothetical protein
VFVAVANKARRSVVLGITNKPANHLGVKAGEQIITHGQAGLPMARRSRWRNLALTRRVTQAAAQDAQK